MTKDWFMDYAEHALRVIELEQEWLEMRYRHLYGVELRGRHDVQWTKEEHGRFTGSVSSGGGSAGGGKSSDIVEGRTPAESNKNNSGKVEDTVDFPDESDIIESGIEYLDSKPKLAKHGIDDCYDTANPHYGEGEEYAVNCQRCVIAYEARRRGFDVTARPASLLDEPAKHAEHEKGWANVFENGSSDLCQIYGSTPEEIKGNINSVMKSCGNGTRAVVEVHINNKKGHVFIAEYINGKTHFIDPQTGERDVGYIFDLGISANRTRLLRTDDKKFTSLIEEYVE